MPCGKCEQKKGARRVRVVRGLTQELTETRRAGEELRESIARWKAERTVTVEKEA